MNRLQIIKNEIISENLTGTVEEITEYFNNKPLIDNPITEPPQVPANVTLSQIFGAAIQNDPTGAFSAIQKYTSLLEMTNRAINNRDTEAIQAHLLIFGSELNQAAQTAINTLLSQTQADPNWTEQILGQSKAEELNIYPVKESEVFKVVKGLYNE